jgi:hypothetical protein
VIVARLLELMELSVRLQLSVLVALVAVVAGCKNEGSSTPETSSAAREISAAGGHVQSGVQHAAIAAKTFVAENKDQFLAASQKQLRMLDSAVSDLTKKSESYRDDVKAQVDKLLATVKEKREAVAKRFEELRIAGKEASVTAKSRFASSLEDFQKAIDEARSKIN